MDLCGAAVTTHRIQCPRTENINEVCIRSIYFSVYNVPLSPKLDEHLQHEICTWIQSTNLATKLGEKHNQKEERWHHDHRAPLPAHSLTPSARPACTQGTDLPHQQVGAQRATQLESCKIRTGIHQGAKHDQPPIPDYPNRR